MQQTEKKKNAFPSWEFGLCHSLLYVTTFLNKIIPTKFLCSLRSSFHRAIYDSSKFCLVLSLFVATEIIAHAKQWSILFRRCVDGSKLLIGLLCSFHLTSAYYAWFHQCNLNH